MPSPPARLTYRYIALSGVVFLSFISIYRFYNVQDFTAWGPELEQAHAPNQHPIVLPDVDEPPAAPTLAPPPPPPPPPRPKIDWNGRAEMVKEAFLHAYHGYEEHAFPMDELRPLSLTGTNK